MSPVRIQRRRTKGWRMPEGAVYVGRWSAWGNPYRVSKNCDRACLMRLYQQHVERTLRQRPDWLAPLRGKDLVCWCPLDQPCHADVLLELANS